MLFARLFASLFAFTLLGTGSALAQGWAMVDTEGGGGAGAYICPLDDAETGNLFCLRLECGADVPLHYEIAIAGGSAPDTLPVDVSVDDLLAGRLEFVQREADGYISLTAPFDPRLHRGLIQKLRKGNAAALVLKYPDGDQSVEISLRGSSRSLGAVMETCPMPELPLNDPAALVLDEIATECAQIGGSVMMEPGFERHEDLDGDGREDVVVDYAAAVCSEMASLYCGSGGCTVGFFLARGEAYTKIYSGVIRGYSPQPGGRLALDLHGTACGLYGFEACRKVFDITGAELALVDELAGEAAEAAMAADSAATAEPPAAAPEEAEAVSDAPSAPPAGEAPPTTSPEEPDPAPTPVTEAVPVPAPRGPGAVPTAPKGLEWIGDGGEALPDLQGETLPEDLLPEAENGTGKKPAETR